MNKRSRQKDETRCRILQEAIQLIAVAGFSGFRTVDVAAAAGISHGALFVHYTTRSDLALRVAKEIGSQITGELHALASKNLSFRSALNRHLGCLAQFEGIYRFLIRERHLLPEEFNTCWAGMQSAVSQHLWKVAKEEIKVGAIRKIEQHFLFNLWIGLIHHYILNRELFVSGKKLVLVEHGPTLTKQFINLLREQGGRSVKSNQVH